MLTLPIKPMLLHKSTVPPEGSIWIHQLKFDGIRCILVMSEGTIRLFSRHEKECTRQFPEMQDITLKSDSVVLDGEIVVLEHGKPCFEDVLKRYMTGRSDAVKRLSKKMPAHFVAFDVLFNDGVDLRNRPLEYRLGVLEQVVDPSEYISVCQSFEDGVALFEATKQMGLEGVVSKRLDSIYSTGTRSNAWLKTRPKLIGTKQ